MLGEGERDVATRRGGNKTTIALARCLKDTWLEMNGTQQAESEVKKKKKIMNKGGRREVVSCKTNKAGTNHDII